MRLDVPGSGEHCPSEQILLGVVDLPCKNSPGREIGLDEWGVMHT